MQGQLGHPAAILLVEDELAEVRLLQEVFTLLSVRTQLHVVREGREALAFLRHNAPYQHAPRPALMLLSLKLPGMSGQQLLTELKRDLALQTIPALVFTNSQSPEDIRQSYELGANSYILKPFEFTKIVEVVHAIAVYWLQIVTPVPSLLPPRRP
jgi:CheY-like chemotaxis protein